MYIVYTAALQNMYSLLFGYTCIIYSVYMQIHVYMYTVVYTVNYVYIYTIYPKSIACISIFCNTAPHS